MAVRCGWWLKRIGTGEFIPTPPLRPSCAVGGRAAAECISYHFPGPFGAVEKRDADFCVAAWTTARVRGNLGYASKKAECYKAAAIASGIGRDRDVGNNQRYVHLDLQPDQPDDPEPGD